MLIREIEFIAIAFTRLNGDMWSIGDQGYASQVPTGSNM